MRTVLVKLLRKLSVAFALVSLVFPCEDPRLQKAVIGGDAIVGTAFRKPGQFLRSARVHLYLDNKLIWVGTTDKNGGFKIRHLDPDTYELSVAGWGRGEVQLKPEVTMRRKNGQVPAFYLMLIEDTCVAVTAIMN